MQNNHSRIRREGKTIRVMVQMYCRDHHSATGQGLCAECAALEEYALLRLERCPFQEGKTTCARCPVHCYQPQMRELVRQVMRYAGPRMPLRHPMLALSHIWDGRRRKPVKR